MLHLPGFSNVAPCAQTKSPPTFSRPRCLAPDKFRPANAEFDSMLELGTTRPVSSSWPLSSHKPEAQMETGCPVTFTEQFVE